MNKLIKALILIITTLSLVFAIGIFAYADDTNTTDAVWRVTHKDGTTEELYSFSAPFYTATSGDYFEFLPSYYEALVNSTIEAKAYTDYTLDFGSSSIVFTSTTMKSSVIEVGGVADVTILGDGCTVYLQNQTSAFMSFNGNSQLYLDGGRNMFRVLAPDAFEIIGNSRAEIHNAYIHKHCPNMMAGLSVRGNGVAHIYDSIFYTDSGRFGVFAENYGNMTLVNCDIISRDNSNVMAMRGSTAKITFSGECRVYGNISYNYASVKDTKIYLDGVLYTNSPTFASHFSKSDVKPVSFENSCLLSSFVSPNSYTNSITKCSFTTRYSDEVSPSLDIPEDFRVWELIDENGQLLGYTESFSALSDIKINYQKAKLLTNVVASSSIVLEVNDEKTIDLSLSEIVAYSNPYVVYSNFNLINLSGDGKVSICANSAKIYGEGERGLVGASDWVSIDIDFTDGLVSLGTVARVFRGDLTVKGLNSYGSTAAALVSQTGKITVLDSLISTTEAPAISSVGEVAVTNSTLVSKEGAVISTTGSVILKNCPAILGEVLGNSVSCTIGTILSDRINNSYGFYHKNGAYPVEIVEYAVVDGLLTSLGVTKYIADFITISSEGGLLSNLTLGSYPILNVYVPMFFVSEDSEMAIHIIARGVCFTGTVEDSDIVTINSGKYLKFSYPYIYSDGICEEVSIQLEVKGEIIESSVTPFALAYNSLELAENERVKTAIVRYLYYALYASYEGNIDETLSSYSSYFPTSSEFDVSKRVDGLVSSISLDIYENRLYIYTKKPITVTYTYGGRTYREGTEGGRVTLYWHRLDPSSIKISCEDLAFSTSLPELYSTVCKSPSRSSELLSRYIEYMLSISEN